MSAKKTWLTNPYNGTTFVDPDSGGRYAIANNPANPANPGDVATTAPDAPQTNCEHTVKAEWLGLETQLGLAVYVCQDCGVMVTRMGARVFKAREISHE